MADTSIRLDEVVDESLKEREEGWALIDAIRMTEDKTLDELAALAHQTGDRNPELVTVDERAHILDKDTKLKEATRDNNHALLWAIWERLKVVYLSYKSSALQRRRAQALGGSTFKLPPLQLPTLQWVDASGSRTMKDTVAVSRWIQSIKQSRRLLGIDDSTCLEIVRSKVPDSLKTRALTVVSLPALYALALGDVPEKHSTAREIERRLSSGPPGGPGALQTPQQVEKYARETLDLVEELASLESRAELTAQLVASIVDSFPSSYAGDFLAKRRLLEGWAAKFKANRSTRVAQLRIWLDNIRATAAKQMSRERSYGPQWGKTIRPKEDSDLLKRLMMVETRVRDGAGRPDGAGGAPAAGRGSPGCFACEKTDHMVAACDMIRRIRDNGEAPPSGLCLFCLHRKKSGESHFIDEKNGCHIGPATSRQRRLRDDKGLRRDYLCHEHKIALPLCRPCFISETRGKANEVPQPKYLGGK